MSFQRTTNGSEVDLIIGAGNITIDDTSARARSPQQLSTLEAV
jgi:hypothetical protein